MQIKNVVCYSPSLNSQDVLAHVRLIGPLRYVGINIINGTANGQPIHEYAANGDAIIIQRDFPGSFKDYQKVVEIAKHEAKPIVFDLDDLLFCLPDNHPARKSQYYAPSLLPMFQALEDADLVTVSTAKLKSVLDQYHGNVVVLPNYCDDLLWQFQPPVSKDLNNEALRLGYIGGNTHAADLEYIAPALLNLIKRYGNKIHLHFWGAEPPEVFRSLAQASWSTQYHRSYRDFVQYFRDQSADIFIAPLCDNLFNRCKSPIKFLDYGALGAAGVFSHLEPYSSIVVHGKNGLLAGSVDEWFDCMVQLIEDPKLRMRLATGAQATIQADWLLSRNAFRWREVYDRLGKRSLPKTQESKVNILESINVQLSEAFVRIQEYVQSLNERIVERDEHVRELGAHIAERDEHVRELGAHIAKRDEHVRQLGAQIQALGAEVATRNEQLKELNEQLLQITRSKAWRLVIALRRIQSFLFRSQR